MRFFAAGIVPYFLLLPLALTLSGSVAYAQATGLTFGALFAASDARTAYDQVDLPAYHIHYDIHSWEYQRKPSMDTYDVYRDGPDKTLRISQSANSSNYALVVGHDMWVKHSGVQPLRLLEFSYAFPRPLYAHNWALRRQEQPTFLEEDAGGKKLICGTTSVSLELCFDSRTGLIESAQIGGQKIRYGRWIPIGNHFVPGTIEMWLGTQMLFDAEATVDQSVSSSRFDPPPDALQLDTRIVDANGVPVGTYKEGKAPAPTVSNNPSLEKRPPVKPGAKQILVQGRFSGHCQPLVPPNEVGFAEAMFDVDQKGRSRKVEIEADSKRLGDAFTKWAKKCTFDPQLEDGVPKPFQTGMFYTSLQLVEPKR